ncbi:MAG: hypothetical protein UY31_C0008G0004 [Candidatus Wolfebacteria bacterium GW2011_GWE1_48_7]|nr:MAG: hypothetical protein UX49_C0002G0016 [Candidatus Wolfebacteria bacterium GW2011_GWC2_46_275]KKU42389.1 MAG: hypothetical protein UX58_C0002G0103 [Candidatus Wolfebacteria bacterium GW2011_GWB2_46_69]KKU54355.1 MAG: hypothetical protein UX76_C0003G0051 [Candidatus Wolfebacteria bacterium GW2011_GWC1_47_103]KKU59520.1 MAG: hypothetical protein UX83_C0004G0022 [Candidatus Wolfebacteria bacterium GW2011_GWE2_47_12]KKU66186.1 MAG: hypothetical protein UX90_C0001G0245 [Candidatus Wolfebacteri
MCNDIKNIGAVNRAIRAIVGLVLVFFAWKYEGGFSVSLTAGIIGVALIISSITGFCFIVRLVKNTKRE